MSVSEPTRVAFAALLAPVLDELLARLLSAARAEWPLVELEEGLFFTYLAQRVPSGSGTEDPAQHLASLAVADLYLACACAQGNTQAIRALEARYFREIDHALGRLGAGASQVEDVKQQVRQSLFVGASPGITSYSGSGQLRRWIRVIAVRTLHRARGQARNEVAVEDNILGAMPDAGTDPELFHIKQHYREAFHAAFSEAVTSLSSEERVLLRQHFVDGLNIDEIAALHRVHRATAARWLVQARERIAGQTRKLLLNKIKGQRADFDSILRLVQSQLDLSIRGHLRDDKVE